LVQRLHGALCSRQGISLGAKATPGFGKSGPEAIALSDTAGSEAKWQEWSERLKRYIREREAIVAGLRGIAEDESREGDERIFAILEMARTKSDKAVIFMLNNIDLWVRKNIFDEDDESVQQPCFYALKSMGWQIIPQAVEFAYAERSQKQLELLTRLFEQICGPKVAGTLLEVKRDEFVGHPAAKAQAVRNITEMLRHIRGMEKGEK